MFIFNVPGGPVPHLIDVVLSLEVVQLITYWWTVYNQHALAVTGAIMCVMFHI